MDFLTAMEQVFDYRFKSTDNLSKALPAAGPDGRNNDGNRGYEQLGLDLVGMVLSYHGLMTGTDYRVTATLKQKYCSYEHRQQVARRIGIEHYISCVSETEECSGLLAITLAAILGAVYIDSGHDLNTASKSLAYIRFYAEQAEEREGRVIQAQNDFNLHPLATTASPGRSPRVPSRTETLDWVDRFIQRESVKCNEMGLATPEESYYNLEIKSQIQRLGKANAKEIARKLLFFIASAESVEMLKGTIQKWRIHMSSHTCLPPQDLTAARKFEIIQGISQDIAALIILRRYYILDWFQACGGSEMTTNSGFIECPGGNRLPRRSGNPLSLAKADITSAMMKEIFPDLQQGDPRYKKEYAAVKHYRQLGWKFSILAKEFGRGILALLSCRDVLGANEMGLSDEVIAGVPESIFKDIVSILKNSQGETWNTFSAAASSLLDSTILSPFYDPSSSNLEDTEATMILKCPKNSAVLLHLLQSSR